jgi:hypothetical protein
MFIGIHRLDVIGMMMVIDDKNGLEILLELGAADRQ